MAVGLGKTLRSLVVERRVRPSGLGGLAANLTILTGGPGDWAEAGEACCSIAGVLGRILLTGLTACTTPLSGLTSRSRFARAVRLAAAFFTGEAYVGGTYP